MKLEMPPVCRHGTCTVMLSTATNKVIDRTPWFYSYVTSSGDCWNCLSLSSGHWALSPMSKQTKIDSLQWLSGPLSYDPVSNIRHNIVYWMSTWPWVKSLHPVLSVWPCPFCVLVFSLWRDYSPQLVLGREVNEITIYKMFWILVFGR